MNNFGVIVRPNVAPNIRPPAVKIKIETDDDSDVEIIGQRGKCIDLDHGQSMSATFTEKQAEQFRLVDRVRSVPPNRVPNSLLGVSKGIRSDDPRWRQVRQYIDLEVMHYIQYNDEFGHQIIEKFRKPEHSPRNGVFIMEENIRKSVRG